MNLEKVSDFLEVRFWNCAIYIMKEEGPLMKIINLFTRFIRSKAGFYSFLVLVWAAVGFLLGLVLGRLIWFFQLV